MHAGQAVLEDPRAASASRRRTAWARPARTGGTKASASTAGTPSRACSAASATRTRRFQGQISVSSSACSTYASSGRSRQPGPAGAQRLEHGRALAARPLGRASTARPSCT